MQKIIFKILNMQWKKTKEVKKIEKDGEKQI